MNQNTARQSQTGPERVRYSSFPSSSSSHTSDLVQDKVKLKVKCSRYRTGVVQRVGRGIALLFHDRGTRRGWVVSSTPRPHFNPGKDPVPILQEAGWTQGLVWTGGKSRPHRDSIPDSPASSQSLYRLSYPAHAVQGKVRSRKYAVKHKQRMFQLTVSEPWVYEQGKVGLKGNFFVISYHSLFWKLLFADITWTSSSFSVAIWRTSPPYHRVL